MVYANVTSHIANHIIVLKQICRSNLDVTNANETILQRNKQRNAFGRW